MAGLILALICAAAADQPVPGHTVSSVVSERGPAINQGPRQIQYKGSSGLGRRHLVNAYEVKANIGVIAGNTV